MDHKHSKIMNYKIFTNLGNIKKKKEEKKRRGLE